MVDGGRLFVAAGSGTRLELLEVQVEGRKRLPGWSFCAAPLLIPMRASACHDRACPKSRLRAAAGTKRKPESHSDVLLRSKRVEALSPLDRNLATTLVMGVVRWQLVLQQRIREVLTRSKGHLADPVQVSLELGALQLLLLERIPAHAAVFESVELVRQSGNRYAVGLANAVLRKLAQSPRLQEADACAAHPSWMVERWVAAYGGAAAAAICRYDQLPPPAPFALARRRRPRVCNWSGEALCPGPGGWSRAK